MELSHSDKKSINELYGIIKGIDADNIINQEEIKFLQEWLINNKNYENSESIGGIYNSLKKILEDSKISKKEKEVLLKMCESIEQRFLDKRDTFSNLLGIIQGISCDRAINDIELEQLKNWLNFNLILKGNLIFDKIFSTVNKVLEDGFISYDEERELLELFDCIIISKKDKMMINYIRALIKQGKNIGNNVILLFENEKLTKKIHLAAKAELLKALNKSTSINILNTEIIFISLCLIALENYDGNFYDYVAEEYEELYESYTRQRIDGIIRTIIKNYIKDETTTRQINYVLENVLVPLKYLPNYFDFVFDIYKINFQFLLDENKVDEDIEFVFNGLKDVFNDNSDDVSIEVTNKTYKLIKSTKNLIFNSDSIIGLRNFTKNILKIIDDYYWNNNTNLNDKYYQDGFDNWISKNNKEVADSKNITKEDKDKLRSKWLPSFKLIDKDIYLHIPEHKIKNDYDYSDIKISIYQDNIKIKEITDFKVFSIIGGYKIDVPDIRIDNPLSSIQYKIEANREIIYDSNDLLKNDYILFNEKGISINSKKHYEGNLFIVLKSEEDIDGNIKVIYKSDNYYIGTAYIKSDTILKIKDNYITFNTDAHSGLVGTIYENTYIECENRNVKVYKDLSRIIFETEVPIDEIGIKINEKRFRLEEADYINKYENGKNILYINYRPEENGYYEISFFNTTTGKNLKSGKYEFFIDTQLDFDIEKIDKNNYTISVKSKLIKGKKDFSLNINEFDDFSIQIDYNSSIYKLPLNIPMYKIDDGIWHSVEDYIWIDDIKIDSILYIQGLDIDDLLITNSKNEQLTKLKAFNKDDIYRIPIGTLRTYIDTTEKIYIFLRNNLDIKQFIECYMKCSINYNDTLINFDSENEELDVKVKIYGKGTFKFSIFNESEDCLFEKVFDNNYYKTKIKHLQTNKQYKFKVFKIATGFSLDGDIEIYSHTDKFYSFNGLVGKNLKVKSVDFDIYDKYKKDLIRKTFYLHRTYFHIEKYLGNKKYIAKVYKWEGYESYLNNINPIEIELSSEIESNNIEVAAYKDGDGLLIDFDNKSILDSIDDLKASDIYSCKLIIF